MGAKCYLNQIDALRRKIQHRQKQLEELRSAATSVGALDYSRDIVKTSKTGDILERQVVKIADLEADIARKITAYEIKQNEIIGQIEALESPVYIDLLCRRYIDGDRLEKIATDMGYSFDRVRHLHGLALLEFERVWHV